MRILSKRRIFFGVMVCGLLMGIRTPGYGARPVSEFFSTLAPAASTIAHNFRPLAADLLRIMYEETLSEVVASVGDAVKLWLADRVRLMGLAEKAQAVVGIFQVTMKDGRMLPQCKKGSGFLVQGQGGRYYVVTAAHVVRESRTPGHKVLVRFLTSGPRHFIMLEAHSLLINEKVDLAVLGLPENELKKYQRETGGHTPPVLTLGTLNPHKKGVLHTIGYPATVWDEPGALRIAPRIESTVFKGFLQQGREPQPGLSRADIASGLLIELMSNRFLTGPGSSGSPVTTGSGKVVGVAVRQEQTERQAGPLERRRTFAVPTSEVLKMLETLEPSKPHPIVSKEKGPTQSSTSPAASFRT